MVTYTTTYSLAKPTVADDEDVWGGYLNGNFDTLESLLKGTTALTAINVTGNITVGGTVDGRDVAADGSKLDGIEAGATADQTKADIDALGINAATLDSLDSTQFLRSDASDSMSGALSISQATAGTATLEVRNTGGSGNNALVAKFWGDSDGLEIRNHAQGDYRIVNPQQDNGISIMDGTGGVKLRYNGVDVAGCDSSGGFEVTGAITASGTITSGGNTVLTTADYDVQVCHLKTNVDASVTQGSANEFTVNFNLEEHNDTSTFSHSSGVVTVATAGWYRIVANLVYENAASSLRNTIRAYVKKNGTEVTSTATYDYDRGTSYGEFSNNKINTLLYLAANDTIEIANYGQNIDGTVTIQSEECEFMVSSETVQASSTNADTVDGLHASSFALKEADADLDMNNFDIYGVDQIFHHGDTNTYIQFHAADQFRVVTGGTERFEVNNTRTQADRLLVTAGLHERYEALSGTTPTCDVDLGGGFSLTMTGNTTFTFGAMGIGSGSTGGFVLELTGNGSTVTWPTSVVWAGGTAPDAPASGETDLYVFYTRDNGTTWYGVQSIDAAA